VLGVVHLVDLTHKNPPRLIHRQDSNAISSKDSFCMQDGLYGVHGQ